MSAQQVRILNPVPGGNATTSLARARRFERKGRAEFIAPFVIRFKDGPLNQLVTREASDKLLAQNTGYDRTSRTFYDAARHIPVINAAKMIREERSSRKWSFTASVRRHSGRIQTAAEVAAMREA